jgi:hypothetical protein
MKAIFSTVQCSNPKTEIDKHVIENISILPRKGDFITINEISTYKVRLFVFNYDKDYVIIYVEDSNF